MHEQWDPVMLEIYLREVAAPSSAARASIDDASSRRRAVLSQTLTEVARRPMVDLSRTSTAIDLTFD